MGQTVGECELRIALAVGSVHRLQKDLLEVETGEALRLAALLRVDELELVPVRQHEWRAHLGTHADPVDTIGGKLRAIRLHRDLESVRVKCEHGSRVQLKERLAAGADDELARARRDVRRPLLGDRTRQRVGRVELSAARSVDADEVRVAELARRVCAIALAPRPQIASGETTEYCRPAGIGALTLQREEDLLHRERHVVTACSRYRTGSLTPAS